MRSTRSWAITTPRFLRRYDFREKMRTFFEDYDLLLTPTLPVPAFDVGCDAPPELPDRNIVSWVYYTYPFNLTGQPRRLGAGGLDAGRPARGHADGLEDPARGRHFPRRCGVRSRQAVGRQEARSGGLIEDIATGEANGKMRRLHGRVASLCIPSVGARMPGIKFVTMRFRPTAVTTADAVNRPSVPPRMERSGNPGTRAARHDLT